MESILEDSLSRNANLITKEEITPITDKFTPLIQDDSYQTKCLVFKDNPDLLTNFNQTGYSTIFSSSYETRIRARRLRIQQKLLDNSEKSVFDPANILEFKKFNIESMSKHQIESSRCELEKSKHEYNQLIFDVIVANNAREQYRRLSEEDSLRTRREKSNAESNTGKERFEEITRRWDQAISYTLPNHLYSIISKQTNDYNEMHEGKNRLISELETELKFKDENYVKTLKVEGEDVDLLLERMDNQAKKLSSFLLNELKEIDTSFMNDRNKYMNSIFNDVSILMKNRQSLEMNYSKDYQNLICHWEQQLDHLISSSQEEYRMASINLEKGIQLLQYQLEQMKATFHLNLEKLEYNFQVVKKRDEENSLTQNQQKRMITRFQDQLNSNKLRLKHQQTKFTSTSLSLKDAFLKTSQNLRSVQILAEYFKAIDLKQHEDILDINLDEIHSLIYNVIESDRIIHEHLLGLSWIKPYIKTFPNQIKIFTCKKSVAEVVYEMIVESKSHITCQPISSNGQSSSIKNSLKQHDYPIEIIKSALILLSKEADFLVEEKLNNLMKPLEDQEQILMKLDSIFSALHIESVEDILDLLEHLIQTSDCDEYDTSSNYQFTLIEPSHLSKMVKEFQGKKIEKYFHSHNQNHPKTESTKCIPNWSDFTELQCQNSLYIWSGVLLALEKYLDFLKKRKQLIEYNDSLQVQNSELKMLVQQYLHSQVNRELIVPPTHLLSNSIF